MPRPILILVLLVVVLAAALYFFSTQASEVPTRTIETEVNLPANAS